MGNTSVHPRRALGGIRPQLDDDALEELPLALVVSRRRRLERRVLRPQLRISLQELPGESVTHVPVGSSSRKHDIDLRRPRLAKRDPVRRPVILVEGRVHLPQVGGSRGDIPDERNEINVSRVEAGDGGAARQMNLSVRNDPTTRCRCVKTIASRSVASMSASVVI